MKPATQKKLVQFLGFFCLAGRPFASSWPSSSFSSIDIGGKGGGAISWEFLTQAPRRGMTEGGIFPAIFGTFLVTLITALPGRAPRHVRRDLPQRIRPAGPR